MVEDESDLALQRHLRRTLTTDYTDDADRLEKLSFRIRVIRAIRGSFSGNVAVVLLRKAWLQTEFPLRHSVIPSSVLPL